MTWKYICLLLGIKKRMLRNQMNIQKYFNFKLMSNN